jgi:hypothetical protein
MFLRTILLSVALLCLIGIAPAQTELSDVATWAVDVGLSYSIIPNVTYSVANNYECKLDAYIRKGADTPVPTVISIHGGVWSTVSQRSLSRLRLWRIAGWHSGGYSKTQRNMDLTPPG